MSGFSLNSAVLLTLEDKMRVVSDQGYNSLNDDNWFQYVTKRMPSSSRKEIIQWFLDTMQLRATDYPGGKVTFENLASVTHEYESGNVGGGLFLKKEQLEDLDGNGIDQAANWARQAGAQFAYWPQDQVAKAINEGESRLTYDGLSFFNAAHPFNPLDSSLGTFQNIFTGAADAPTFYPGALPIDASVSVDVAMQNMAKAIAYIANVKQANGRQPRKLRVAVLLAPPALAARAVQLTNAKLIAQATGAVGGSADVDAVVRSFGLGQPIICDELGAAYGGSDTTWYLGMKDIISNQVGALTYVEREPFSIVYHGPQTDADLARKREFQWTAEGRNTVGYGHPFLLFKCKAA